MKVLDIKNWERKDHFDFFNSFDYPNYSITANVNITKFYNHIKQNNLPFFASLVFVASKTLNNLKNFKLRIRGNSVVEHDIIHPVFTILSSNNIFNFCPTEYVDNYSGFISNAQNNIKEHKTATVSIKNDPDKDNVVYITSIPWVSFTQISHPFHMNPVSSIPIIAWGKYFELNGELLMPLSVQANHALIDGFHLGEYFNLFQKLLDSTEDFTN